MTPLNERVREYMGSLGYKWYNDTLGTYGFAKKGMPEVYVETANEWYLASLQAQKDELLLMQGGDEEFQQYSESRIASLDKLMETDHQQ